MQKSNGGADIDAADDAGQSSEIDDIVEGHGDVVATVATVAVVGIGAAAFEAALLPGIVLGVAAMWLPQYFPKMGQALNPLFKSTVRGAYKLGQKTKEIMAEAQEQVHDIVAEVRSEDNVDATPAKASASGGPQA